MKKVNAPKHADSFGSSWSEIPAADSSAPHNREEYKSLSSTILRLFLTMKCGALVFVAASCRARERIVVVDFTERTYPRICVTHMGAPLNPRICLTGRLIGDCGRDEARWRILSERMAASLQGKELMMASHEASQCKAHFVEVCLTNEPRDARNLMRRFYAHFESRAHWQAM